MTSVIEKGQGNKTGQICLQCKLGEVMEKIRSINGQKILCRYCSEDCGYLMSFKLGQREVIVQGVPYA